MRVAIARWLAAPALLLLAGACSSPRTDHASHGHSVVTGAPDLLQMAANILAGEIAAKAGDGDVAERLLRAAVAEQDTHWFTEPPPWYFPVRQALGAVLLQQNRAADAEQVYREDLRRNPANGWSLFGLAQSLKAQGKTAEATEVEARFRTAWARADVPLDASRF